MKIETVVLVVIVISIFSFAYYITKILPKILKKNRLSCFANQIADKSKRFYFKIEKVEENKDNILIVGYWAQIQHIEVFIFHLKHPDYKILSKCCTGSYISFYITKNLELNPDLVTDFLRVKVKD